MAAYTPLQHSSASPGSGQPLSNEDSPSENRLIVLAGNPNVGKSAIFNALTGLNADVSNYPGTTLDVARGKLDSHDIVDTPGIYGVSSFNDEERIAREIILQGHLIINVVSALSLDRDLFLTLQLVAFGKPMLLVINQWDEAAARGIDIDTLALAQQLGIPIVTTVATRKEGIDTIKQSLPEAAVGKVDDQLHQQLQPLLAQGIKQDLALLSLEGDVASLDSHPVSPLATSAKRAEIYKMRREAVNTLFSQHVKQPASRQSLSIRLGRLLLHPWAGSITAVLVCYLIFYQLLGVFVAGTVVDLVEKRGLRVYYEPAVRSLAAAVFPCDITADGVVYHFPRGTAFSSDKQTVARLSAPAIMRSASYNFWSYHNLYGALGNALAGEYGVLTLTVTYLIGLLMPLVIAFYFALSILEDSGYLPRLAVLVDRVLNKFGLNGRAIIPLILGLGCVTMATVTTRLLSTTREKIIATALLGVAIPCSAQLGIVAGTLAKCGGPLPWIIYGTIIGGMLGLTGVLLNMVMPGKSQGLMIDLPPMRLPRMDNVLKKTWSKSFSFMKESVPMFCIAGLVVTFAQVTGLLQGLIDALKPITVGLLNLPNDPRIATTFVLGIVRRDFAAFGLTDVPLSASQAVVAMVVITLFVPCIATVGIMMKERGPKIALTIWFGSWLCAFLIGGILARLLPPLFHIVGS